MIFFFGCFFEVPAFLSDIFPNVSNVATSHFKAPDMHCWSKWTPGRRQQLMVPLEWDLACLIHCAAGKAAREMLGCTVFFFMKCLYRQCIYPMGWQDVIGHSKVICLSSPMEKSTSSLFACDQASSGHVFYQIPKKNNLNLGMSMFETPKLPSLQIL